MYFTKSAIAAASLLAATVLAESHTITLTNKCGKGTPTLVSNGEVVSTGPSYTTNGEIDFTAYLQVDNECDTDGNSCIHVTGILSNSELSHAAIFRLPNAQFQAATGYNFVGGGSCDGQGQDCTSSDCTVAVNNPTFPGGGIPIHFAGVNCTSPNVNFNVKFCD